MHYLWQLLHQEGEAHMWDYMIGMKIDEGVGQVLVSPKTEDTYE